MTKQSDRFLSLSRRDLLKAGAVFALTPPSFWEAHALEQQRGERSSSHPPSPAWTDSLIIYEIAPKGFTSPNGPQSGTFASLQSKLPYLNNLGITGIWLTGYSLCDPTHFYNIWTQYAVIEPDKLDPTLGTAKQFKALIDEAHHLGIKVFLDVITHGLTNDSPIVKEHPSWFHGGSWGMTDFDWTGGHKDLNDWWVKVYTDYVAVYGVDGYRLDVNIYRPDLWARIRQNAAAAGHPIAIWEEHFPATPGVTDFTQRQNVIGATKGSVLNQILVDDLPGFYDRKFGRDGYYEVEIQYEDHSNIKGSTNGDGPLAVRLAGLSTNHPSQAPKDAQADALPDVKITLDNLTRKPITNIVVRNDMDQEWHFPNTAKSIGSLLVDVPGSQTPLVAEPKLDIYVTTLAWGASSIQLSCHDNGWEGFPSDKNPYIAQGSRSLFGYSFIFTPMIPIFFSGEEFDASFHALPQLSPNLYGGKDPGKGRWLYGAMPDWNELKEPEHNEMLVDVKRMIAIRKQYSEALGMCPTAKMPNLKAVKCQSNIKVPVPYLRWDNRTAILVAGNRNVNQDAMLKMQIDLSGTPLAGHQNYSVTDLWSQAEPKKFTAAAMMDLAWTITRDRVSRGGLLVLKIEPA